MHTLRPNDFFLNEDAPATIDQSGGTISVRLAYSADCFISAPVVPPANWHGDTLSVRLVVRSTGVLDTIAAFFLRADAWPSSPDPDGAIGGSPQALSVPVSSVNPVFVVSDSVEVPLPEEYTDGMLVSLNVIMDNASNTDDFEPRIMLVQYEFI
jgi:hypothetical protein